MEMQMLIKGDSCHATLQGQFVFSDNLLFKTLLDNIANSAVKHIILYMEQVHFVDSAALGMLLLARDAAEKHHKTIIIEGLHGQVKRMFEMARFYEMFTIR